VFVIWLGTLLLLRLLLKPLLLQVQVKIVLVAGELLVALYRQQQMNGIHNCVENLSVTDNFQSE
jgi:hypothetical protein